MTEDLDEIKIVINNQEQEIMTIQKKINDVQMMIISKNNEIESLNKNIALHQEVPF